MTVSDELLGGPRAPSADDLTPESVELERRRAEVVPRLARAAAVCITHTDCDGLGAGALVSDYHGPDTVVVPVDYGAAYGLTEAIDDVAEHAPGDAPVYICDLNPDSPGEAMRTHKLARSRGHHVEWLDHHQWPDECREAAEKAGCQVAVDEDECATSLVLRKLGERYPGGEPADFDGYLEELAEVTKDIDLWIREDPRSERLAALAEALEPDSYIEAVLRSGAGAIDEHEAFIDNYLASCRDAETDAEARAVSREAAGLNVAMTYLCGGRASRVGNALVEDAPHDLAVVMGAHGGAGVYSHSDDGPFICDDIAAKMGGGGHETASGFSFDFDSFDELAGYWSEYGATKQDEAIGTIVEVAP